MLDVRRLPNLIWRAPARLTGAKSMIHYARRMNIKLQLHSLVMRSPKGFVGRVATWYPVWRRGRGWGEESA